LKVKPLELNPLSFKQNHKMHEIYKILSKSLASANDFAYAPREKLNP
jgi:hypothetical protein